MSIRNCALHTLTARMIKLSDKFTYGRLIRFVAPSVITMIAISIYGVIDGFFVSNFVGKTAFAAVNLMMPFIIFFGAFGFMVGSGGSALVAKTLGEGRRNLAHRQFSLIIYFTIIISVILSIIGLILIEPIAIFFGAEGDMIEDCINYASIIIAFNFTFVLQEVFQTFMVTAEKPKLGMFITIAAGLTNIILDALLIIVFEMGIIGAAIATVISQIVGGIIPLVYFATKNSSTLKLTKTGLSFSTLFKTCSNGFSELLSNISMSFVSMLYNFQLMKYIGEDGVAAYGAVMYINFIFASIFLGFDTGSAPIFAYKFGAKKFNELRDIFFKSLKIIAIIGLTLTISAEILAEFLTDIFVGYDKNLQSLTIHGLSIYAISFIFVGFNIFASSFFTSMNNGLISAIISVIHTVVCESGSVLILPLIFGINGIWFSINVAEFLALLVSFSLIWRFRRKYLII